MKLTLADGDWMHQHPKLRLSDLMVPSVSPESQNLPLFSFQTNSCCPMPEPHHMLAKIIPVLKPYMYHEAKPSPKHRFKGSEQQYTRIADSESALHLVVIHNINRPKIEPYQHCCKCSPASPRRWAYQSLDFWSSHASTWSPSVTKQYTYLLYSYATEDVSNWI